MTYASMRFFYNNNFLHVEDYSGYESRNSSMVSLIKKAWEFKIKNQGRPEPIKHFSLYTDDVFDSFFNYSFAITNEKELDRCMPSFVFNSWPECGVDDYESVFQNMAKMGDLPFEDERVFWIGAVNHLIDPTPRLMGQSVSDCNKNLFDFRFINWQNRGLDQWKHTDGYVGLVDHCRYRVLIDFGGAGFSARIPLLLASGRPVILVGHPQEAWFYWDGSLIPWHHYIPCGAQNGFGLKEQDIEFSIKWTFQNPEICKKIGKQGRDYAEKYLTRSAIVEKIAEILITNNLFV